MPQAESPAGGAEPDDETLVRLARQGNRPACEELFQRHRAVAYRVAYRLLGNEHDAEEAVQEGTFKAFSGLREFDGRSGFRTWLVRIVSNAAIDLGRKRSRRRDLGVGPGREHENGETRHFEAVTEDDPTRGLHRDDLRRALDSAMARLSLTVRNTFVLFAEGGLSYKEIAEVEQVPIGTVMSRLYYARQKLQSSPELQDLEEP